MLTNSASFKSFCNDLSHLQAFDPSSSKKKKRSHHQAKKPLPPKNGENNVVKKEHSESKETTQVASLAQEINYSYAFLLNRVYDQVKCNGRAIEESSTMKLPLPNIGRGYKCVWSNFQVCLVDEERKD